MIEEALSRAGMVREDIGLIACVSGPGSFTGIRIGVSAAKAIAHALGIPCVAVNALEALAFLPYEGVICPMLDARGGQVYGAAYRKHERLMEDGAMKIEEFLERIHALCSRFLFIGSGAAAYRGVISRVLAHTAAFAQERFNYINPGAVAALALANRGSAVDYLTLAPYYLRAPQAERERAQKA
jgi:tRNA threonylcarbamoyladenosine biosynthesis protein TsaB